MDMSKDRAIAELKKGVKSWNAWRKAEAIDELNLDGLVVSDMNFDKIDFSKVSLRRAKITGCSFRQADLTLSNLQGSQLQNNDFSQAKLIAADLGGCDLSGSILFQANMLTAVTRNAKLENIDFRGHDISGLMLRDVSLLGSNLEGQDLSRVDLTNSNLTRVNLQGANLTKTLFVGAQLISADLRGANFSSTNFREANLQNIDLSGFDLRGSDFTLATLEKCDLRSTNLTNVKLNQAKITGVKLWNVTTSGWSIANVECDFAYWDRAGKEKTVYRPHEFERIFAESMTIELRYPYRLADHELATMPIFIEHLAAVHWGSILRLKSITDVAGGALVKFVVEEVGNHSPSELKVLLQAEAERIQLAQLTLRRDSLLHLQLKEKIAAIREEFWPRLLELAADHEMDQARNLTILFMDLKGFSQWADDELSDKLALFRGLVKPILKKWGAEHPNMEGDSLRVTFRNATAGLSCACMMRSVLMAAGFELRLGLELGEVMVVYNEVTDIPDLEGVAVSMAARLEAIAQSGEVLVSHKVRHYAERSEMFTFVPRRVPLKKSIGNLAQGEFVECFSVEATKKLQDSLT